MILTWEYILQVIFTNYMIIIITKVESPFESDYRNPDVPTIIIPII